MRLAIIFAAALAGCAHPPPPPPPTPVPEALWTCQEQAPVPAGLPKVRTPTQLGEYGTRVELAREAERRRGDACAANLDAVHEIARANGWAK